VLQQGPAAPAADSIQGVGSTLVLRRNEPTEITVRNLTRSATSIHWHGIELESFYDGVGGWSGWGTRVARPIAPGDSFVVRITPPRAGTFIYHTHVGEGVALASGLYGALVVLPEQASADEAGPVVLVSMGGPHDEAPTLVNGSTTPGPILLQAGRSHRFRLINISPLESPTIQLQSGDTVLQWRALAKDGADLPAGRASLGPARVVLHPGETYDFEVVRERPESLQVTVTSIPSLAERRAARARGIPVTQLPRVITAIPVVVR
jgi:FtsP/CotA-like multicopper oxidase with cupredoxin domain